MHATSSTKQPSSNTKDTIQGPLTRSRAKKLQVQVNSFLTDFNFSTSENVILPKCSTLVVLRNIQHEEDESGSVDSITGVQNGPVKQNGPTAVQNGPVQRTAHNSQFTKAMEVNEDSLESLSSQLSNATNTKSFGLHTNENQVRL